MLLQNEFFISSIESCPGNQPLKFIYDKKSFSAHEHTVFFSGTCVIPKDVPGPIEATADISRCDVSMKQCENYPNIRIQGLCQMLKHTEAFYYNILSKIEPQIKCPVKAGNYVVNNSSIDLSAIAFIPMSGSVWLATLKIFSGKNRELTLCSVVEFKIVRAKGRKRKET